MSNIIEFRPKVVSRPSNTRDWLSLNWLITLAWFSVTVSIMRMLWENRQKRPPMPVNDQRNVYAGDPFIR